MSRPVRRRQSLRIPQFDYASAGAYFVTICVAGKACLFGDVVDDGVRLNEAGRIVRHEWLAIQHRWSGIELDDFVVMPNHMHGIVWLGRAGLPRPGPRATA